MDLSASTLLNFPILVPVMLPTLEAEASFQLHRKPSMVQDATHMFMLEWAMAVDRLEREANALIGESSFCPHLPALPFYVTPEPSLHIVVA